MITIYHNPRCSKSRQGLALVEQSKQPFKIVLYLKDTLSVSSLKTIIKQLDIPPLSLVRKSEAIWKTSFKERTLSDSEIIQAMVDHPKLIERPIVVRGNKGVIGRPPETITSFLNEL